jgi:hypothetical protein
MALPESFALNTSGHVVPVTCNDFCFTHDKVFSIGAQMRGTRLKIKSEIQLIEERMGT